MPQLALYPNSEHLLAAVDKLKERGFDEITLISPIPLEEAEEMIGELKSPVKYFSFFGGLFGCIAGFALAAGTAVMYPLPVGGRPIITFPPFLVISYELTILFGVISTVIGFFFACRFPKMEELAYAEEANVDKFALVLDEDDPKRSAEAQAIMAAAGAEEIRQVKEKP
jgi:hypothetical protein